MILIGATIYFAVASLVVLSLAVSAARPMPSPPDINDGKMTDAGW